MPEFSLKVQIFSLIFLTPTSPPERTTESVVLGVRYVPTACPARPVPVQAGTGPVSGPAGPGAPARIFAKMSEMLAKLTHFLAKVSENLAKLTQFLAKMSENLAKMTHFLAKVSENFAKLTHFLAKVSEIYAKM